MFSVLFTLPPDDFKSFLISSKDFAIDIPTAWVRIIISISKFFVISVGNILAELVSVMNSFLKSLFSYRLICVVFGYFYAEFVLGWIYSRDKMKCMVKTTVDEVKIICAPLFDAIVKILEVLSNPWQLLVLSLIILVIRIPPELWIGIFNAAKSFFNCYFPVLPRKSMLSLTFTANQGTYLRIVITYRIYGRIYESYLRT